MSQASPVPAVLITPPQQRPTRCSKRGRAGGDELEPMARGLDPATDVQEQMSKTQCRILEAETSSNSGDPPAQPEGAPAIHSTSISATEASRSPLQGAGAEVVEAVSEVEPGPCAAAVELGVDAHAPGGHVPRG